MYKKSLYCLIIFSVISTLVVEANEQLSAEQILRAYEQTLEYMKKRIAFDSETEEYFEGAYNWDMFYKSHKIIATTYRDGECLDTTYTEYFTHVNESDKRRAKKRAVRIMYVKEGMRYEIVNDNPLKYLTIDSRDPNSYKAGIQGQLCAGQFLDGYAPGHSSFYLPQVMREGGMCLKDEMETVDGHKTYVLEAKNRYGKKTIWIDPEFGYCPRRIVMQTTAEDIYYGKTLGTPLKKPLPLPGTTRTPIASIDSEEIKVESIQIENINGIFLPTSAVITTETIYSNGEFTKEIAVHKRTNIDLNPDFGTMGAFVMDVPDGTPVFYKDDRKTSGVAYEWFDGEVRAKIDELFLESLDNQIGEIKNRSKDKSKISVKEEKGNYVSEKSDNEETNVLSKSHSKSLLLLIIVSFSIIIFGWKIFAKQENRGVK